VTGHGAADGCNYTAALGAHAQEKTGFYVGAGVGQSYVDDGAYDDKDTAFPSSAAISSTAISRSRPRTPTSARPSRAARAPNSS
jgi:hypothetical protein